MTSSSPATPASRAWFRRCRHERVRCTHGDEIIARGWRRRVCLDCGRALKGDLPNPCTVTGQPHQSQVNTASQPSQGVTGEA